MSLLRKASIVTTPTSYENGKILSVKPSIVLGEELITNGDFATDSDWILGNNTTISGGKLINSNSSAYSSTRQSIPMSVGTYLFTYTIDSISGGGFFISFTGFNGITRYAAGTYSEYVTLSSASTTIFLAPVSSGMTYTIDNVSVKEAIDADFDFTRNSSATRVNSQGLIEDMQILSGDLISNGDFSQEGAELITNGDFSTDSDWTKGTGWSIGDGSASCDGGSGNLIQSITGSTPNKTFLITFTLSNYITGSVTPSFVGAYDSSLIYNANGTYSAYINSVADNRLVFYSQAFIGSIDNVSVKEVGQDWSIQTGTVNITDKVEFVGGGIIWQDALSVNTSYKVTYEVVSIVGVPVFNLYNGSWISAPSTVGTHTVYITMIAPRFYLRNLSNEIIIDNISVIEITSDTNLPRIDYTGGTGHWLFEPQSTNLITYSEDFSDSSWNLDFSASYITRTPNAATSPSGENNATKLIGNDTSKDPINSYIGASTSASAPYASSIFAKKGEYDYLVLGLGTYTDGYYAIFNLSNGTISTLPTASGTSASIEDYGNGWFRCIIATTNTLGSELLFTSPSVDGTLTTSYTNTTNGVYIWAAQLEESSYATSYIPTEGSIKTRLQDAAFGAGSSDLINSTEGVFYLCIAALSDDNTDRKITISDGTFDNSVNIGFSRFTGYINADLISGGVLQTSGFGATGVTQTNYNKFAMSWGNGITKFYVNGILASTHSSVTSPIGLNAINFAYPNNTQKTFARCKTVAVFKEALTDAELTCLTTI